MDFTMNTEDLSALPIDEQVVLATRRVMANKPDLEYAQALEIALGANPKLAKAYADSNGYLNADRQVIRPSYSEE